MTGGQGWLLIGALMVLMMAGSTAGERPSLRRDQNAAHNRRVDAGSAQLRRSCRCDNITACMLWKSEKMFSAHQAATTNYHGHLEQASQMGRRTEVQHMAMRFNAAFNQLYVEQVQYATVVLKRLETMKRKLAFEQPHKFINQARNVNQAIIRLHSRFDTFVQQVMQQYQQVAGHVRGLVRG